MKEQIKEIRVNIDGLYQLTKELKPMDCNNNNPGLKNTSKEIEDAAHSLIYAKAWLGKVLGELGEETPYKNDGNRKDVKDIEPAADKEGFFLQDDWCEKNHIEKVDWLRQEIQSLIRDTDYITSETGRVYIYGLRVEQYLSEARFALGFELSRCKKEHENKR